MGWERKKEIGRNEARGRGGKVQERPRDTAISHSIFTSVWPEKGQDYSWLRAVV